MDISFDSYTSGEYAPVPRRDLEWKTIQARNRWSSGCGNIVVCRWPADYRSKNFAILINDSTTNPFSKTGDRMAGVRPPRWRNHPSKASAVHFAEHVYADANPKRMEARMYSAPIHIEWNREEAGIYYGNAAIGTESGTTQNMWSPVIRLVGQPNGWHLELLTSSWWRYEGDINIPFGCDEAFVTDATRHLGAYGSKKAATVAAGYLIRDFLGRYSSSFGFGRIPAALSGWFDDGRSRELLASLVADAVKRGLCREMFLAHVYGSAVRKSEAPSVIECADAAKALLCDFVISTWAEAK